MKNGHSPTIKFHLTEGNMKRIISLVVVTVAALMMAATANAWHPNGVVVTAKCNVQTGVYDVTAEILQSSQWPGAFVKSITPSWFAGNTTGSKSVVVVLAWSSGETWTAPTQYVTLAGTCIKVCEPVTVERIVYVDRPVEVIREVVKEVPVEKVVEKVVEKPVIKTIVKWKTRVVVKWKTRTVVKRIIITKIVHDRCPPPPVCCVGKG